jgi:RNA polymerase-binding transcription factor DksA
VGQTQDELLQAIREAIDRIDQGTYGQCAACGQPIPQARLRAMPYALRCIDCEEKQRSSL